ncbi:ESX-1 associated ATP-binding protein EpsI N-terminal domain-containing protein, partial [Mycolicibacterium arseniciresistens]|nr:MinD/ParA family protein [Mycolicibacterium arseniciresistens]
MSADYDRLFNSPDSGQPPEEATRTVDREALMGGSTSPVPATGTPPRTPDAGPPPPPMPIAQPRAQAAP